MARDIKSQVLFEIVTSLKNVKELILEHKSIINIPKFNKDSMVEEIDNFLEEIEGE